MTGKDSFNIMISSAGKRVSLTRFFQTQLNKRGDVLCADANPSRSPACQIAARSFEVPLLNNPNYIETFLQICLSSKIKLVVPTLDTELMLYAAHRERFRSHGIELLVSDSEFIEVCQDKRRTLEFFSQCGIDIANIVSPDALAFPFFARPINGSRSVGSFLCEQPDDLSPNTKLTSNLILQEALSPEEYQEVTVDLHYNSHHKLCRVVPRLRMEVRDGEVSKSMTVDRGLVRYIRERLSFIPGARGPINIQVFLKRNSDADEPGSVKGIEINPRFGGGYPLSYHAGANLPRLIIDEYFHKKTPVYENDWNVQTLMLRYDDEIIVPNYRSEAKAVANG